jgi:hypothetical protein
MPTYTRLITSAPTASGNGERTFETPKHFELLTRCRREAFFPNGAAGAGRSLPTARPSGIAKEYPGRKLFPPIGIPIRPSHSCRLRHAPDDTAACREGAAEADRRIAAAPNGSALTC